MQPLTIIVRNRKHINNIYALSKRNASFLMQFNFDQLIKTQKLISFVMYLKFKTMELTFEQLPKAVASILESVMRIENLLQQKKESVIESDRFLTVKEAAEFLDVSVSTIYKLTCKMEIPCDKKCKHLYFMKSDLVEWIKTGRRKTIYEIKAEADNFILRTRKGRKK